MAVIRPACCACSGSSETVWPSTVAVQTSGAANGTRSWSHRTATPPATRAVTASAATPTPTRRLIAPVCGAGVQLVRMERGVERDAVAAPRDRLDGARDRVAPEQQVVQARQRE